MYSYNLLPTPARITDHIWPDDVVPVLSVICVTYNHKNFIGEAIESFLMQETSFPVEILIHDDASNDGTSEIIQSYSKKYPKLIRLILQKKNQFSQGVKPIKCLRAMSRGEYIALCEGDDYWTVKYKLEIQVHRMKQDQTLSAVAHNAMILNQRRGENELFTMHTGIAERRYSTEDLIQPWFIPTASFVYRRSAFEEPPSWAQMVPSGDIVMTLCLSLSGDILFLSETMSIYRLHDQGLSTTHVGDKKAYDMVHLYQCFDWHTHEKHQKKLRTEILYELKTHLSPRTKAEIALSLFEDSTVGAFQECIMLEAKVVKTQLNRREIRTGAELKWFLRIRFRSDLPVIIWGLGSIGRRVVSLLERQGIQVSSIVDKENLSAVTPNGITYIPPSDFVYLYRHTQVILLLTTMYSSEVIDYLMMEGWYSFEQAHIISKDLATETLPAIDID